MGHKINNSFKMSIGLIISVFFLYLAFRQVDLQKFAETLKDSNVLLLTLAVFTLFISHWLRAVRHRLFLNPIKKIKYISLFSALMIGYMANSVLPAHLGEVLRAYIIGKKECINGSLALATIVVERIVDVLSLLIIMGLIFMVYPFPEMVKLSAYLTFAFALGLVGLLILLKLKPEPTLHFIQIITRPFPKRLENKLTGFLQSFRQGLVSLRNRRDYLIVSFLSFFIWLGYAAVFEISFYAFDFINLYQIPIGASLVVLVMTTISILVPSSPGYIGTYHWLCMLSLSLFGIPNSTALGYAVIVHAINIIPIALVGLLFAIKEGLNIANVRSEKEFSEITS